MKKNLFISIIMIGVILMLSGCYSSYKSKDVENIVTNIKSSDIDNIDTNMKSANVENTEDDTISAHIENTDYNKIYDDYIVMIDEYMNNFKNSFFNVVTMEENITMITGVMDIDSTEGNFSTKYVDSKGNVIRFHIDISGETCKTIKDYYILTDKKLFVVELHETYSSPVIGSGNYDILSYDLKKFMIDGNNVYCLDDVAKDVIVTSQKETDVYMSLDDLTNNFIETKN